MNQNDVKKMVVSAIMVALSAVLSLIKIVEMPFGGSVTLLSMLPVALVSVMYGIGWGLGTGFVSAVIQLIFGITMDGLLGWGLTAQVLAGSIVLDYLLPFTLIGLAGIFRKYGYLGVCLGTALAVALRFLSHFASGIILWANFEEFVAFGQTWVGHPVLYSLCYNGAYMLPELIITVIGTVLLFRSKQVRRLVGME